MSAVVQAALSAAGYELPVDPDDLARENIFEVRHVLRGLGLDEEQIEAAEAAVELVRAGRYPALARKVTIARETRRVP